MNELRCLVLRGLPKEIEEEMNKFLEQTAGKLHGVTQSEDNGMVTLTILYVPRSVAPKG